MKLNRILLYPDAEGETGGSQTATSPAQSHEVFGEQTASSPDPGSSGSPPASASPSTPPMLTADDIAEAMKKAGLGQPAAPAEQPRQYSQEDFDKAFNVYKPTKVLIQRLRKAMAAEDAAAEDDALAAIVELVQGTNKQAVTMSAYQMEALKEELMKQFAPLQTDIAQRREEALKNEFYATFEDLKQHSLLVDAVTAQLRLKGGFPAGTTKEKAFEVVAGEVKKILAALPGGNGAAPTSGQPKPQPSRMSTLTSGGQGGGGGQGGASKPTKSPGHAVFS